LANSAKPDFRCWTTNSQLGDGGIVVVIDLMVATVNVDSDEFTIILALKPWTNIAVKGGRSELS